MQKERKSFALHMMRIIFQSSQYPTVRHRGEGSYAVDLI